MKLSRCLLVLLAVFLAFGLALGTAETAPPTPQTPTQPPRPPSPLAPDVVSSAPAPAEAQAALPPLKAVLVVGPIDGDYGARTTEEKANADLAASELVANGVTVYKFYAPNNDWGQIKAAAAGAQFFLYRGHGVYWSAMPSPTVGGFALSSSFVSSDDIRAGLRLAPNALVMLYGCFTAGSSSIDETSISSAEAQRRVAEYSDPFLDVSAAGYYANWYGNAFQLIIRYLFQGMTLGRAYESFFDFNAATVERYAHPLHPAQAMWLDKDYWGGMTQYNHAFVGSPERTLTDLFANPPGEFSDSTLQASPSRPAAGQRVTFTTRLLDRAGAADGTVVTCAIPNNTVYVPGSATTTRGTVSGSGPIVFDVGTVLRDDPVTLTFDVTVDAGLVAPTLLRGPVTISWQGGSVAREHIAYANGFAVFLPMVTRP